MHSTGGTSFAQVGFFAMADASPAMIWVAGADKLCYWFNRGWLDFTGRSQELEFGNGWTEGVHPDDMQSCLDAYVRHFDAREHFLLEYRLRRHDGEYRWLLDSGTPRYDGNGNFEGYNGICFDIHERKQFEELQRQQSAFMNAVLDCEPECVKVVSPDGDIVLMNRTGLELLEVDSLDEVKVLGVDHFILTEYRQAFHDLHRRVMSGQRDTLAFEIIGKKGTRRWLETHCAPLLDDNGAVASLIGVTRDITEHRALLRKLERQAQTDYLTGLPNRGHFFALADLELNRSRRYGGSLSILMLDLDHFKDINDQHGHQAGDLVLQTFAATCRACLRDFDIIGRLGGEEFAVLLPQTDSVQAFEAAQRLRQSIAETPTALADGQLIRITASFGVTSLSSESIDLDGLILQADRALYNAKRAGRNCVLAHA